MFQKETPDSHLHSGRRLILWWGSLKWGGALNWYWMLRPWVSFASLTLRGTTEKSLRNRPAHEEKTCYWHITPAKKEHLGTKRKFWEIESVIAGEKKNNLIGNDEKVIKEIQDHFPELEGLSFPMEVSAPWVKTAPEQNTLPWMWPCPGAWESLQVSKKEAAI